MYQITVIGLGSGNSLFQFSIRLAAADVNSIFPQLSAVSRSALFKNPWAPKVLLIFLPALG